MAANDNKTSIRDSDSEENEFEGFLASDLVNLCDEDLSSNTESETEANMSDILLSSDEDQSDRSGDDEMPPVKRSKTDNVDDSGWCGDLKIDCDIPYIYEPMGMAGPNLNCDTPLDFFLLSIF